MLVLFLQSVFQILIPSLINYLKINILTNMQISNIFSCEAYIFIFVISFKEAKDFNFDKVHFINKLPFVGSFYFKQALFTLNRQRFFCLDFQVLFCFYGRRYTPSHDFYSNLLLFESLLFMWHLDISADAFLSVCSVPCCPDGHNGLGRNLWLSGYIFFQCKNIFIFIMQRKQIQIYKKCYKAYRASKDISKDRAAWESIQLYPTKALITRSLDLRLDPFLLSARS